MESTAAILLRRTKFSDTSLIVTWLTCDHGKLKTVAKGALRPKSPFAGTIDLFFETEIAFVRSSRSEIHTLREAVLRHPFEGLRKDYARLELAAYFVELQELLTESDHPVPELFDLLHRALGYLENATPDRRALLHFENELARLLGINDEGSAYAALARTCHHMPESRRRLMEKLG
ncbi:MAG: DNA repair protein RecO [Verrucomicrobiota bacterium]